MNHETHKYDFRPKLHNTKFNYHFITAMIKSQNSVYFSTKLILICSQFAEKWKQKGFYISFCMQNKKANMVQYRIEMMRFRTDVSKFDVAF